MTFTDFLIENDEFERKDANPADRISELKRIGIVCQGHMLRIMNKWHTLAEKGLITKTDPRDQSKGGTYFRIPETFALNGKWYSAVDWGTPEGQRLEKYFHILAKKEAQVIERGRIASEQLRTLEKDHAANIDNATKNALNSVKTR